MEIALSYLLVQCLQRVSEFWRHTAGLIEVMNNLVDLVVPSPFSIATPFECHHLFVALPTRHMAEVQNHKPNTSTRSASGRIFKVFSSWRIQQRDDSIINISKPARIQTPQMCCDAVAALAFILEGVDERCIRWVLTIWLDGRSIDRATLVQQLAGNR